MLAFEEAEIDSMFLSTIAKHRMGVLLKMLNDLDEVTKIRQWPDAIIHSARACFDTVPEGYLSLLDRFISDVQVA